TDTVEVTVNDVTDPTADAGEDKTVDEDKQVIFNGSDSYDNVKIVSYNWTIDGENKTGEEVNHTFSDPGEYEVILIVYDAAGNHDTDIVNITVLDITDPKADAGPDRTVDEDTSVVFDASSSYDNVGIVNYSWKIEGMNYYGINVSHTFTQPGKYTVELNVTDAAGNHDTDEKNITVVDTTSPEADAGSDQIVALGEEFVLNGSGSSDNVDIINYTWTHDKNKYYGVEIKESFSEIGTYKFTLNVTDSSGNWDIDRVNISVEDQTKPTANAGSDKNYGINETFTLDGSKSADNVGIVNYRWIYNENEWEGKEITYSFSETGTFQFVLNVTDEAGNHDTDIVNITVQDQTDPVADAGNNRTLDEDEPIVFEGNGSTDNVGIVNYTWTVGSEKYYGEEFSKIFEEPGIYDVNLIVKDEAGNSDTDVITITVRDTTDPTASFSYDKMVKEDTSVTFNASSSNDNVGIVEYRWSIGEEIFKGEVITHTFETPGIYVVSLNVSDEAGNYGTMTSEVEVKDVTDPKAGAGEGFTVSIGEEFRLDGNGSTDNVGIESYEWILEEDVYSDSTFRYSFDTVGVFEAKLKVVDSAGNSDTDIVNITVEDMTSPEAGFEMSGENKVDKNISLDASISSDNVGIESYEWQFGDGTTGTGESVTHTFEETGNYTITLTVTDEAGNTDTYEKSIRVEKEEDNTPGFTLMMLLFSISLILLHSYRKNKR
ncbi:MAG: PKD domain-containing protein, partial [Thermoplasmatota archaeon]